MNEPRTILVVDDDALTRRMLETILEGAGLTPICVGGGAEALAAIGDALPRLVLLDLVMAEPDGFEVLRQLRARPRTKSISASATRTASRGRVRCNSSTMPSIRPAAPFTRGP